MGSTCEMSPESPSQRQEVEWRVPGAGDRVFIWEGRRVVWTVGGGSHATVRTGLTLERTLRIGLDGIVYAMCIRHTKNRHI